MDARYSHSAIAGAYIDKVVSYTTIYVYSNVNTVIYKVLKQSLMYASHITLPLAPTTISIQTFDTCEERGVKKQLKMRVACYISEFK